MIDATVERMYATTDENRFLEVTYQSGDKEILYFKDFSSGAMIENIVRAGEEARRSSGSCRRARRGIMHPRTCSTRSARSSRRTRTCPNTTNPDDWAKISGKKGERIVYVRTLIGDDERGEGRQVERVNAGQYL